MGNSTRSDFFNNGKKKVDRKSLKIKTNLKDSLKCNIVDLIWILICTNYKRTFS